MIDPAPVNSMPPPEPLRPLMGWLTIPSIQILGKDRYPVFRGAQKAFNAEIDIIIGWSQLQRTVERLTPLAGLVIYHDPNKQIARPFAQVIDFFFGRDKQEALVYIWQPFEENFRLVDREWLLRRRV